MEKFRHTTRANARDHIIAIDVSAKSRDFASLSPFNNIGNIPHPCCDNMMCMSVECIWQGSKVFSKTNIKPDYFILFGKKSFMKNKGKKPIGTWVGDNNIISDVGEARRVVYIPAYIWTLENRLRNQIDRLLYMAYQNKRKIIYLYDFDWNDDIDNPAPLSHASILVTYLNEKYNDKKYMSNVVTKYDRYDKYNKQNKG